MNKLKQEPKRAAVQSAALPKSPIEVRKRRAELASIFMAFLIGIAYQELVNGLRPAVLTGHTLTFCLSAVFVMTSIRFLIGAHAHLTSPALTSGPGANWLLDLVVITGEMLGLVLVADFAGLDTADMFLRVLYAVLLLDVAWVGLQIVIQGLVPALRREAIPWKWAALNLSLVAAMWLSTRLSALPESPVGMGLLLLLNFAAFVIDLWFVDQYDLMLELRGQ